MASGRLSSGRSFRCEHPSISGFLCDIGSGKVTRGQVWLDPSQHQTQIVELALTPDLVSSGGTWGQVSSQAAVASRPLTHSGMGEQASPPPEGPSGGHGAAVGSAALWPFTWTVVPRSRFRTSTEDSTIGDIFSSIFIKAARPGQADITASLSSELLEPLAGVIQPSLEPLNWTHLETLSICRASRAAWDCDSPQGSGHKQGPPWGTAGNNPQQTEKVPSVNANWVLCA